MNPTCRRFKTYAISFTSYLSEETLKAGGPLYLVSMPGEVKYPTQGVNVLPVVDSLILEKTTLKTNVNDSNGQQVDRWSLMEEVEDKLKVE